MRFAIRFAVITLALSFLFVSSSTAAWIPNGTPVLGVDPSVTDHTLLAPDEAGGVLVGSRIAYSAGGTHGSRFTADGELVAGFGLPPHASFEHAGVASAALVPDGAGGVFVLAYRTGRLAPHLFVDGVQLVVVRMNASGEVAPGWPAGGVVLDSTWIAWHALWAPQLSAVATRDGGVLVAWLAMEHSATPVTSIRAQSIGSNGGLRWGTDPRVLDRSHGVVPPAIAPDGAGGALVFWGADSVSGRDGGAYAQRIDASGTLLWGDVGVRLSRRGVPRVYEVEAVAGDHGGAIVAWLGRDTDGSRHVYATRLEGSRRPVAPRDFLLGDPDRSADQPAMAPTDHGAIVAWCEVTPEGIRRVKAQRLDERGRPRWQPRGALVCSVASNKRYLRAVSDGREGAYIAWGDDSPTGEIQAARITPSGRLARGWSLEGTPVCAAMFDDILGPGHAADLEALQMTPGRGGTAYLTWVDTRMIVRDGVNTGDPEQGFVMKLDRDGPAARPVYPTEPVAAATVPPGVDVGVRASSVAPAFALHGVRPNPAVGPASVAFTLPSAGDARLELFDVAGRRVWSRDVGALGAGEHRVPLGDGVALAPGLYLLRLHDARHRAGARVVITR